MITGAPKKGAPFTFLKGGEEVIPQVGQYNFVIPIENGFFTAVNPLVSNGVSVINRFQKRVLEAIDGISNLSEIASRLNLPLDKVEIAANRLKKCKLIRFDKGFKLPTSNQSSNLSVWMHSTDKCTLDCTYCFIEQSPKDMSEEVYMKLIGKLEQTAAEGKLKKVTLRMAGGEPLPKLKKLEPILNEFRNRMEAVGCEFRIAFISNLTYLNQDIIDFLKKNKYGLSVSMDGLAEYHDKTRVFHNGNGSFAKIDQNLNTLLENGIKPFILIVVSNSNIDGLKDFTQYLLDKKLGFRYSFVGGEDLDYSKATDTLIECYGLIEKYIDQGNKFFRNHRFGDTSLDRPTLQACGAGKSTFSLYLDGSIYICQREFADGRPIGNIFHDQANLFDILGNRQDYLDLDQNSCSGCMFEYNCAGGCPLQRVDGKISHCQMYQKLFPVIFRLKGKEMLHRILNKNSTDK